MVQVKIKLVPQMAPVPFVTHTLQFDLCVVYMHVRFVFFLLVFSLIYLFLTIQTIFLYLWTCVQLVYHLFNSVSGFQAASITGARTAQSAFSRGFEMRVFSALNVKELLHMKQLLGSNPLRSNINFHNNSVQLTTKSRMCVNLSLTYINTEKYTEIVKNNNHIFMSAVYIYLPDWNYSERCQLCSAAGIIIRSLLVKAMSLKTMCTLWCVIAATLEFCSELCG